MSASEMQPGREMDLAVAAALGYVVEDSGYVHIGKYYFRVGIVCDGDLMPGWSPSQCDRDAGPALDAMLAKPEYIDYHACVFIYRGVANVSIYYDLTIVCGSGKRPVAICKAILALAEQEAQ